MQNQNIRQTKRLIYTVLIIGSNKGRTGTKDILEKLKSKKINVSLRTIQRDLRLLEELTQIINIDDASPMGVTINQDCELIKNLKKQFKQESTT